MDITRENDVLSAALKYASWGWPVLPLKRDKSPYTPNGRDDAKTDPYAIKHWWTIWPDAGVGIATGIETGFIVIDLDVDEEKGKDGPEELRAWERETGFKLPDTVEAVSGRGGRHLYYRYDFDKYGDQGNREGILPGIDVRGRGGYIVAPPTIHPNGREYFWDIAPEDMPMAEVDEAVLAFLKIGVKAGAPGDGPSDRMKVPEMIPCGTRNGTLFRLACSLQAQGLPDDAIYAAVQQTNETACETPIDDKELCKLIESALKYDKGNIYIDYGTQAAQPTQPGEAMQDPGQPLRFTGLTSAADLLAKDIPEPTVYVGVGEEVPLLVEGTCILSAKPKAGKSWWALALCIAIANGEDFLGYKTRQCGALYLDLETGESLGQKRLRKAIAGHPVPKDLYFERTSLTLDTGLLSQIETHMQEHPNTGLIVIDVFEKIRTDAKNMKESDYRHAYRDITPLNEIAEKYHISLIIVSHDRKAVDPEDPFANILGSTGLQAAVMQMIVLQRRRRDDPIRLFARGKTLDGEIELGMRLDAGQWTRVDAGNREDMEKARAREEYMSSSIRAGVLAIMREYSIWKGRCSGILDTAFQLGVPIENSAKVVGGFLRKHQAHLMMIDGIKLQIVQQGTASKTYKLSHVDTDHEPDELALPAGFIDMGYGEPGEPE